MHVVFSKSRRSDFLPQSSRPWLSLGKDKVAFRGPRSLLGAAGVGQRCKEQRATRTGTHHRAQMKEKGTCSTRCCRNAPPSLTFYRSPISWRHVTAREVQVSLLKTRQFVLLRDFLCKSEQRDPTARNQKESKKELQLKKESLLQFGQFCGLGTSEFFSICSGQYSQITVKNLPFYSLSSGGSQPASPTRPRTAASSSQQPICAVHLRARGQSLPDSPLQSVAGSVLTTPDQGLPSSLLQKLENTTQISGAGTLGRRAGTLQHGSLFFPPPCGPHFNSCCQTSPLLFCLD